jgi:hypothetical protein
MVSDLHVAHYLKKIQNSYIKDSTKIETILDVGNDVYYKRAKSQYELLSILGYTKITKSEYKVVHIKIL